MNKLIPVLFVIWAMGYYITPLFPNLPTMPTISGWHAFGLIALGGLFLSGKNPTQ